LAVKLSFVIADYYFLPLEAKGAQPNPFAVLLRF
jgi:hypothetical protein